jgi:DNA-binding SARP family transcriptional activator/tetratricopeptide (TPR) repeat protein
MVCPGVRKPGRAGSPADGANVRSGVPADHSARLIPAGVRYRRRMDGGLSGLSAPTDSTAPIQARVLGTFELIAGGERLGRAVWQRTSALRLVKLLLVVPGHNLSREVAAETLWPGADPENSRTNLRKALYFARQALAVPNAISSDGDRIRLNESLVEVDLDRLVRALDLVAPRAQVRRTSGTGRSSGVQGTGAGEAEVAEALATVLELGSKTLLPEDTYEDWLAEPREHLRTRWQAAAIEAARDAMAAELRDDAHAILEQVLERDATDEDAHRLQIDLYATEGRYHAVRRQFERCRRALADGLDASPSAETEAAYRRAERAAHAQRLPSGRSRLVARQREVGLVEPLLDRAAGGHCAALVIRGPAGIGKTRLLEEVRDLARASGWRELAWQAVESTRSVPFAPFAARLAEEVTTADLEAWDEPARSGFAALLPGLNAVPHLAFAERSALQVALVAAMARLVRGTPRLIAIDDLPALDEASIELLGSIATALERQPVLIAVTYRDEEPPSEHVLELLETFRRSGSSEIRLGPLARHDIEPLVIGHLGGQAVAATLADLLFERSEGNPLFCLELAHEASDRGVIALEQGCWSVVPGRALGEAPESVRQIVAARTRGLRPDARELLHVAAELGPPEFGYDTLSVVLPDLPGGVIAALDAALASGLLVERGAGYAFGHPLYRLALASGAGPARRGETQLAIALALSGITRAAAASVPDVHAAAAQSIDPIPTAEHAMRAWELGRTDAAALAVGFGFAAARRARILLDRPVATQLYRAALEVWRRLPATAAREFEASAAFTGLAELLISEGDDAAAEAAFRSALDAARDPDELATAYERFTWLPYRHGDFQVATGLCDEALARLPTDALSGRAIIRQQLGAFLVRLDRLEPAIAALAEAVPVLEANGTLFYLSTALSMLGTALATVGRTEDAVAPLQRSLAIALQLHDARLELTRMHIGSMLTKAGRPAEARPHLARSLELSEQMGDWYVAAVCAWIAAETEEALGDLEAARQMRQRELALLARSGGNPHNEALAHAHLAHLARLRGQREAEDCEAARARALAASDRDPGYATRIEEALSVASWAELRTH